MHEKITGHWRGILARRCRKETRLPAHRQTILSSAPLEVCDRLAGRVRRESMSLGGSQGALILGPIGLIGGIPLSIVQALKAIHHYGLCYGYPPDTETEKLFSYAVLAAATAHTREDKQAAIKITCARYIRAFISRQLTMC